MYTGILIRNNNNNNNIMIYIMIYTNAYNEVVIIRRPRDASTGRVFPAAIKFELNATRREIGLEKD